MQYQQQNDEGAQQPAPMSERSEVIGAGCEAYSSPRLVIRGETTTGLGEREPQAAQVDWLGFSLALPVGQYRDWLENALEVVFCIPREDWKPAGRGWAGYSERIDLGSFGLLAFGGVTQNGKLHVELNAHGCARIQDWHAVKLWGETYEATITRVDLAHDDLAGESVSVALGLQWLREGKFNFNGRPPARNLRDDLESNTGKTLYIGRRGSGKMLRIYEKGKQLGDPSSPWVRAEVELRQQGRVVPWEAVTSPAKYLAGAYPALGFLSAEQVRLRTIQKAAKISYEVMVDNLRMMGGKALNVMCEVHQGDPISVLAEVVREGRPLRLAGYPSTVIQVLGDDVP